MSNGKSVNERTLEEGSCDLWSLCLSCQLGILPEPIGQFSLAKPANQRQPIEEGLLFGEGMCKCRCLSRKEEPDHASAFVECVPHPTRPESCPASRDPPIPHRLDRQPAEGWQIRRAEIRLPSRTFSWSSQVAPAFSTSSLMQGIEMTSSRRGRSGRPSPLSTPTGGIPRQTGVVSCRANCEIRGWS